MKRKRMTVGEFEAKLNADPEFVARERAREAADRAQEAEYRQAQAPLLAELSVIGIVVSSAWDLVNTTAPRPDAVPVLMEHLTRAYPARVREGIARALAIRESRPVWARLLTAFKEEVRAGDKEVAWGMACALSAAADESVANELIEIVRDAKYGPNRAILAHALARVGTPAAWATLRELASDPEIKVEVARLLSRKKPKK